MVAFLPGWVSKGVVAAMPELQVPQRLPACVLCRPKNSAMQRAIMRPYSSMNSTRPIPKGSGLRRFAITLTALLRSHRALQVSPDCSQGEPPGHSVETGLVQQVAWV